MNNKTLRLVITAAVALAVGWFASSWFADRDAHDLAKPIAKDEPKPLFYRNPMNPDVTSPVPAKDQMGMDYIAVFANEQDPGPSGTVSIDPVMVQNIGVRTAIAEKMTLAREIHTVGRVDYDERRIARLHPKTQGWIEDLRIGTTGEQVENDAILLSIYSPQLVSSQQEYLLALKNLETLSASPFEDVRRGAADLVDTSLERLRLLDVPEHQIEMLKGQREVMKLLHIHSPVSGVVVNVGARDGQFVTPQTELYMIADLSAVWVFVDIFEEEQPWVHVGDEAEMRVTAVPGTIFKGKLTYIYPYAERKTRTIKARLEFDNPDQSLKPDMFADVRIYADPRANVVAVPSEAIIRSGLNEQVFVVRDVGKFEPRPVEIGLSSGGSTEIRSGLAAGEEIVVSAQFLIDSESKLREAAAKMQEITND
jgi:Cu(I)/Ag(I) efflux system membrane fusion protein